jgi:hypothetical protein
MTTAATNSRPVRIVVTICGTCGRQGHRRRSRGTNPAAQQPRQACDGPRSHGYNADAPDPTNACGHHRRGRGPTTLPARSAYSNGRTSHRSHHTNPVTPQPAVNLTVTPRHCLSLSHGLKRSLGEMPTGRGRHPGLSPMIALPPPFEIPGADGRDERQRTSRHTRVHPRTRLRQQPVRGSRGSCGFERLGGCRWQPHGPRSTARLRRWSCHGQ